MGYLVAGLIAFGMYLIYDINSFTWKNRFLHSFFMAGSILLAAATAGCVVTSLREQTLPLWWRVVCGLLAVSQVGLLVYTLFFALPFGETYVRADGKIPVYKEGVYALCRHPGVLWFILLYTFLALMTGTALMAAAGVEYSVLNVLYIWFQDRVTFKQTLYGYENYQKETPFLIPDRKSILTCIRYLRTTEDKRG